MVEFVVGVNISRMQAVSDMRRLLALVLDFVLTTREEIPTAMERHTVGTMHLRVQGCRCILTHILEIQSPSGV